MSAAAPAVELDDRRSGAPRGTNDISSYLITQSLAGGPGCGDGSGSTCGESVFSLQRALYHGCPWNDAGMGTGLLERDEELRVLDSALARSIAGIGSVVLLFGEAGIGKTTVVRAFIRAVSGRARVLAGACDDLLTPRTLGPIRDAARATDGPLAGALAGDERESVFTALLVRAVPRPDGAGGGGRALGGRGNARRAALSRAPGGRPARGAGRDLPRRRGRPGPSAAAGARRSCGCRGAPIAAAPSVAVGGREPDRRYHSNIGCPVPADRRQPVLRLRGRRRAWAGGAAHGGRRGARADAPARHPDPDRARDSGRRAVRRRAVACPLPAQRSHRDRASGAPGDARGAR